MKISSIFVAFLKNMNFDFIGYPHYRVVDINKNYFHFNKGTRKLIGNMRKIVMKWNTIKPDALGLKKVVEWPGIVPQPHPYGFKVVKLMEIKAPDRTILC